MLKGDPFACVTRSPVFRLAHEPGCAVDLQTILTEVDSWPVEQRLRLVEEVGNRLTREGQGPELSDAARAEIDRRLAAHAANPDAAIPADQALADALARLPR